MLKRALLTVLISSLFAPAAASAWAPSPERFGEGVRHNILIPMRDGVKLSADVYVPTTPDGKPAKGPFPVLVSETPYGKEAANIEPLSILAGHRPYLVKRGYIQVIVDVRGQGGSGGSFQLLGPDEAADSREVIAWAAKLEHSTGEVGMTGESYLGIVQMFAAAEVGKGSPLKAIFPIVTPTDPYKDLVFSGGLLNLESSLPLAGAYGGLPFLNPALQAGFDPQAAAEYDRLVGPRARDVFAGFAAPTLADVLAGGDRAYEGRFWGNRRRPADVLDKIVANGIPAYLVGGNYDVFQRGEPLNYAGLQNAWAGRPVQTAMRADQPVTARYQLLMKPQYHTTVDNGKPDLNVLQLAWFDHWLKGEETGVTDTSTPLHIAEADGKLRHAARLPLPEADEQVLYLGEGTLSRERPAPGSDLLAFTGASLPCDRSTEQSALGTVELALQPAGLPNPCTGQPVVPASAGPGSLSYTSGPVTRDKFLVGPLAATLHATATTRDTEWIAKVASVAPDGTATDLTQGALLGSHRALDESRTWRGGHGEVISPYLHDTKEAKRAVTPGELTRYDVEIRSTFARIPAGHRLRLTLESSQTPHLMPLPEDLANLAGGLYTVQRGGPNASSLQVALADADALTLRGCEAPHAYVRHHTLRVRRGHLTVRGRSLVPCADRLPARVELALARRSGSRCAFLTRRGRFTRSRSCRTPVRLRAVGGRRWRFSSRTRLAAGRYRLYVQATDPAGRREAQPRRASAEFRVRRSGRGGR